LYELLVFVSSGLLARGNLTITGVPQSEFALLRRRGSPIDLATVIRRTATFDPRRGRDARRRSGPPHARVIFNYSTNGRHYAVLGSPFIGRQVDWGGAQLSVFA
jgi:hypothetical protein